MNIQLRTIVGRLLGQTFGLSWTNTSAQRPGVQSIRGCTGLGSQLPVVSSGSKIKLTKAGHPDSAWFKIGRVLIRVPGCSPRTTAATLNSFFHREVPCEPTIFFVSPGCAGARCCHFLRPQRRVLGRRSAARQKTASFRDLGNVGENLRGRRSGNAGQDGL